MLNMRKVIYMGRKIERALAMTVESGDQDRPVRTGGRGGGGLCGGKYSSSKNHL